jgi:hypothetical protein
MDVSTNYNLIPYPDHNFQIQPFFRRKAVANPDVGQASVERHNRFQWPHPDINPHSVRFDGLRSIYGLNQGLQYPDAGQVGVLVDIYA